MKSTVTFFLFLPNPTHPPPGGAPQSPHPHPPISEKHCSKLIVLGGEHGNVSTNCISNTLFSSRARARRASLASKDSRADTSSSFFFSALDLKRVNFAGFSPRTGSPSTSESFDSAASNSTFAFVAASSADIITFLRDDISFLRSEIRLYVLLTAFLRTCRQEKEKEKSIRQEYK